MPNSLQQYLKSIRPTKTGLIILFLIIIILPLVIDLSLLLADLAIVEAFSFTLFTIKGFLVILLLLAAYHSIYFCLQSVFKKFK